MVMKNKCLWKKIADRPNGEFYQNQKTSQKLVIIKALPKGYIVTTNGEIIRNSKTKTSARSFAKSYMKKNC